MNETTADLQLRTGDGHIHYVFDGKQCVSIAAGQNILTFGLVE